MSEYQYVEHEFAPVYNEESQVLVLGSLPSVKSREQGFYYGHPRNRFWKVVAAVLGVPEPLTIEEKKRMLLAGHVAVYDVIRACEIIGSSDSSIRNVVPADIESIPRSGQFLQMVRLPADYTKNIRQNISLFQ